MYCALYVHLHAFSKIEACDDVAKIRLLNVEDTLPEQRRAFVGVCIADKTSASFRLTQLDFACDRCLGVYLNLIGFINSCNEYTDYQGIKQGEKHIK